MMRKWVIKAKKGWPTLALVVLGVAVSAAYQNCAPLRSNEEKIQNVSPFSDDKVYIQDRLVKASSQGTQVILADSRLVAMVSEPCLKGRRSTEASAKLSFIEKYLPADFYQLETKKYDQFPVEIRLTKDVELAHLKAVFARDECLVGLSGDVNGPITQSSEYTTDQSDIHSQIDYSSGESILAASQVTFGQHLVKVATLDSGYDFMASRKGAIDSQLLGSDLLIPNVPGNLPQDTTGHGTALAHLMFGQADAGGRLGLVRNEITLLPIRILLNLLEDGKKSPRSWADVIKGIRRAVNGGADIINMSFSSTEEVCNPIIGQAIFYGIERGVLFSLAAGNHLTAEGMPGEFFSPREIGMLRGLEKTPNPGCWGQYFKGAVTSSAMDGGRGVRSNFGAMGSEIVAPAHGVLSYGLNNQPVRLTGSSVSAAMVSAALSRIVSLYKTKQWTYSPYRVEDIFLNSQPMDESLKDRARKGRRYSWSSLSSYLVAHMNKTEVERRREASDDVEAESGFRLSEISNQDPSRIEIFSQSNVYSNEVDRIKFHVVAHYPNGSYQTVTAQSSLSVSDLTKAHIDSTGLLYPVKGQVGALSVSAQFRLKTATTSISLVNGDPATRISSPIVRLDVQADLLTSSAAYPAFDLRAYSVHENGVRRFIGETVSWGVEPQGARLFGFELWPNQHYGGSTVSLVAMYRGRTGTVNLTWPKFNPTRLCLNWFDGQQVVNTCKKDSGGAFAKIRIPIISTPLPSMTYALGDGDKVQQVLYPLLNPKFEFPDCPFLQADHFQGGSKAIVSQNFPAQTCRIRISGEYRGMGASETRSFEETIEFVEDKVTSLSVILTESTGQTIDKLYYGSPFRVLVEGVTARGVKVYPSTDITMAYLDGTSVKRLAHRPLGYELYEGIGRQLVVSASYGGVVGQATHSILQDEVVCAAVTFPQSHLQTPIPERIKPARKAPSCTAAQIQSSNLVGAGTQADPHLICNLDHFMAMQKLRLRQSGPQKEIYFKLGNHLDFSGLGNLLEVSEFPAQSSSMINLLYLDGQGYFISDISMMDTEKVLISPFLDFERVTSLNLERLVLLGKSQVYAIKARGDLHHVRVFDSQFEAEESVAPLHSDKVILGALVDGVTVRGRRGLAGGFSGTRALLASRVHATVRVNGSAGSNQFAAGVLSSIGHAENIVAEVDVFGDSYVGGFASAVSGSTCIKNVHIMGQVEGRGDRVGGLVGASTMEDLGSPYQPSKIVVIDSSFRGQVIGRDRVGGLVGEVGPIALLENRFEGQVTAQSSCSPISGRALVKSHFMNNSSESTLTCPGGKKTEPYSQLEILTNQTPYGSELDKVRPHSVGNNIN